eukprot:12581988-Ditylum_brightwellii.AAC.1
MKSAKCDKEQAVDDWKKEHQDVEEMTNTIPHFKVFIQNKSWGPPSHRLEVRWPVIKCAVQDGGYIKTLLSKAYEQGLIKLGKFIPQGYHRMAGKEAFKDQLHTNDEYVKSRTAVTILGMHPDALYANVRLNREDMFLEHYFNHVHPTIKSIQHTTRSEEEGRFYLIFAKKDTPRVIKFVDCMLPEIFKDQIINNNKMEGYDYPICPPQS